MLCDVHKPYCVCAPNKCLNEPYVCCVKFASICLRQNHVARHVLFFRVLNATLTVTRLQQCSIGICQKISRNKNYIAFAILLNSCQLLTRSILIVYLSTLVNASVSSDHPQYQALNKTAFSAPRMIQDSLNIIGTNDNYF